MIKVMIVDDELMARKRIRKLLENEKDIQVVAEAENGEVAVMRIREHRPDLVFLDVQMPGLNGFEVLSRLLPEEIPGVVFVTAYDQYALLAFERHALDYLLKPFDNDRFHESLRYAIGQLSNKEITPLMDTIRSMLDEVKKNDRDYVDRIPVRLNQRIFLVNTKDIEWFEAEGNYIRIHQGEKSYLLRRGLNDLQKMLDPKTFVRIHRSTIVNMNFVTEFQRWFRGGWVVVLQNMTKLPVSRRYREIISQML